MKYAVRDLPLESIHPLAFKAAEATHCAGDQGKYWEMHDRIFSNQRELSRSDLSRYAQSLGLDAAAFEQCMDSGRSEGRIRKDLAEAQRLQITGTPTFVLGVTDAKTGQIKGTIIVGAKPYQNFKDMIERLLAP